MLNRQTLISSGVHIGAMRRLGDSYSADEYLVAVEAARDAGDGEAYATAVLGPDVDELLRGVEETEPDVVKAVRANLRRRGIDLEAATYQQYATALMEVSQ